MTSPVRRRPPMVSPRRVARRPATARRASAERVDPAGRRPLVRATIAGLVVVAIVAIAVVGLRTAGSGHPDGSVAGVVASPTVGPLPACGPGDSLTAFVSPDDWSRTILDTALALPSDYTPPDLVSVREAGVTGPGRLRAFVIDDLQQAHDAARDAGVRFAVKSAYRSFAQQAATFASLEKAYGRDFAEESAARPGHSEHQLGTTIDVDGGEAWLAANGWRYGFVQSYPVERSPTWTCYKPEAWHFRYVGQPTARLVHASGMSLREWLWAHQLDGPGDPSR